MILLLVEKKCKIGPSTANCPQKVEAIYGFRGLSMAFQKKPCFSLASCQLLAEKVSFLDIEPSI